MFLNRNFLISEFKFSWYRKYIFKNLEVRIIEPKYFILVKLEAASKRGKQDFEDAKKIQKYFKVNYDEFLEVVNEYNIEIDMTPGVKTEIEIFIKEIYNIDFQLEI